MKHSLSVNPLTTAAAVARHFDCTETSPSNTAAAGGQYLSAVDLRALPYADLMHRIETQNRLSAAIRSDIARDGPSARSPGRLEDVEESLAMYETELAQRPEAHQSRAQIDAGAQAGGGGGRQTEPDQTRRSQPANIAATARTGVILNAATFKAPSVHLFGQQSGSAWKNSEEFLRSVANRTSDPRLLYNATGTEGTGVDGGFAVPSVFYTGVIDQALQQASFAPRCRMFPSPSNNLTIPMPDVQDRSSAIAGIRANWAGEAAEQSAQRLKWRSVDVKLNKTFILAEASNELVEDGVNYESQLTGSMAEATGYTLDDAILQGTGAGQPLGLVGHQSVIQVAAEGGQAADTVVYANLVNCYSRLSPACQKRATWFISPNLLPQLLTMIFPGSTNPVLLAGGFNDPATGAPVQTIFGRPVIITEIARPLGDAGDIVLADLSQYALVMKTSARLDTDQGPGFARDVMQWRLVMRVGGQPMWNAVLTPYNGGPTLSWAAYLAAR